MEQQHAGEYGPCCVANENSLSFQCRQFQHLIAEQIIGFQSCLEKVPLLGRRGKVGHSAKHRPSSTREEGRRKENTMRGGKGERKEGVQKEKRGTGRQLEGWQGRCREDTHTKEGLHAMDGRAHTTDVKEGGQRQEEKESMISMGHGR
jgi:hypothetical protein